MKKQQWLLGICLLLFIAVLAGATLLYDSLSGQTATDNLVEVTTAPADTDEAGSADETASSSETEHRPAPDFAVTDRDGNTVRLSDLRGKPVILNFWASWCGPCKSEMPDFEQAYLTYGEEIHFVLVNVTDGSRETIETASSYIDGQGYTFPIYFDTTLEASILYGASAIPMSVFIDAEGRLIAYTAGALNSEMLQRGIDMILPK